MKRFQTQRGFSLVELLIAMVVLSIAVLMIGGYVLISKKMLEKTREANEVTRITEQVAQTFADRKVDGPKTGFLVISSTGSYVLDPTEPTEGKRFEYQIKINRQGNSYVYVLANLKTPNNTYAAATALYQITP